MQPGRSPPVKEVFLGTAEIIRRVRDAQASSLTRWIGTARFYALVAVTCVVACALGLVAWRERHTGAVHTESPEPPQIVVKAPDEPQNATGQGRGIPSAAPVGRHAARQPVTVRLTQRRAATVWLDGAKVADRNHQWVGHLSQGKHELAVRVGGHMLRHTFEVGAHPVKITVDPVSHAFNVAGRQGGHRAAPSH